MNSYLVKLNGRTAGEPGSYIVDVNYKLFEL